MVASSKHYIAAAGTISKQIRKLHFYGFPLALYGKNYQVMSLCACVSVCPPASDLSLLNFTFFCYKTNFVTEK
jgi:hypothetical protein